MRPARPDRRKMIIQNVRRNNGRVLEGEKIGELVSDIINKFSEEELSCDEAKIVLRCVITTVMIDIRAKIKDKILKTIFTIVAVSIWIYLLSYVLGCASTLYI